MKRSAVFLLMALLWSSPRAWAKERVVWLDEDGDGRKESKVFYQNELKARAEVDTNGDGQPDRFVKYKKGKRTSAEEDKDYDGKIETWSSYTETGTLEGTARDTNGDGKPDQFKKLVKGRELVLKEYDRNFDGKIDKRVLAQWDVIRTQPGAPGIPGYRNVQREEDNDFDGKIDAYREKGVKDSTAKIGQKMDPEVSWKAKRP